MKKSSLSLSGENECLTCYFKRVGKCSRKQMWKQQ